MLFLLLLKLVQLLLQVSYGFFYSLLRFISLILLFPLPFIWLLGLKIRNCYTASHWSCKLVDGLWLGLPYGHSLIGWITLLLHLLHVIDRVHLLLQVHESCHQILDHLVLGPKFWAHLINLLLPVHVQCVLVSHEEVLVNCWKDLLGWVVIGLLFLIFHVICWICLLLSKLICFLSLAQSIKVLIFLVLCIESIEVMEVDFLSTRVWVNLCHIIN